MNIYSSSEFHEKEAYGMTLTELHRAIMADPGLRAARDYRDAINALDRGNCKSARQAVNRLKTNIDWLLSKQS